MENRKILVSDYDGTFFTDEKGIIKNVNQVNKFREENNLFVMATGNNWEHFQEVISKYNIQCDYLISDQGSCIFDNQGKLLKAYYLDYRVSKIIMDKIKQINREYKLCNAYSETENIEEDNITKMAISFNDLQEALNFTDKINKQFREYVNAYTMIFEHTKIVEIISAETDKNVAIKHIIEKEGIAKEQVYTVGDGYNDISMLQNFNGFCMQNSVEELLKRCPRKVSSVAELLERIMQQDKEIDLSER